MDSPMAAACWSILRRSLVSSTMVSSMRGAAALRPVSQASGASPLVSTLILCLPMWMLSPSCKVARSTRRSFTKVPFRLSRSSTTMRPASKKTFAWWLDTARLSTGMSLSGERPMVTGRLPTGTSFTILLSNMRLSFGISISSRSTIRSYIFARIAAQPRKPSLGFLFKPHNHDGDVVRAAALIGERDKLFGCPLGIGLGLERSRDFGIRDHARQPIGAEQEHIPGEKCVLLDGHFDFRLCAQRAQQHALHVAFFRFRRSQDAAPHLLCYQRMIPCELKQAAAAEQIGATVADVSDAEFCAIDPHCRQCRAHAALIRILFGGLENILVGQMDGDRKPFCPGAPIGLYRADDLSRGIGLDVEAMLHDRFHRHGAGYFTVGFAPHAVRKHKEVQRLNDLIAIFVVGTHATYIGHAATCDSHANSLCRVKQHPCPHVYRATLFPR